MNINAKTIDLAKVQADAEESYRKGFFCCEAVMETIMDNFELDVPYETIRMASGMAIGVGKSGPAASAARSTAEYSLSECSSEDPSRRDLRTLTL